MVSSFRVCRHQGILKAKLLRYPGPCISRKYPICPIFSKVMLKFTENFSMTFDENRTYGVPEFAGTEVNRHSSKLKGLSGYLQNHYPKYNTITSTSATAVKSPMGRFRRSQVASSQVQHHHKYSSSSEYRHNSSSNRFILLHKH